MYTKKSEYIVVGGDFVPTEDAHNLYETSDVKNLEKFSELFKKANDVYVNLEAPITESENKGLKVGPCLKVKKKNASLIDKLGITGVSLANNHMCDYGINGLNDTIEYLEEHKIKYTGVVSSGKSMITHSYINGKKVTFFNFCENEFCSIDTLNKCSLIDPVENFNEINSFVEDTRFKVVILHGGTEYSQIPNPFLKKIARYYIDIGADLVLCHHAHVYSGFEKYKDKYIYFGLGNFIFNSKKFNGDWNEGYLVKLEEKDNKLLSSMIPYIQCNNGEILKMMNNDENEKFNFNINRINKILGDKDLYEKYWENYIKENNVNYYSSVLGMSRIQRGLYRRFGLKIKYFGERKKLLRIYNYISCQSHSELLTRVIRSKVKG